MISFFRGLRRKSKVKKAAEANGINFNGKMGTTVHGLLIHEFGYLLRYYSNEKLDCFDDLQALYNIRNDVLDAIEKDISSKRTKEEESLGVSRETAIANLKNLKEIIISLCNYFEVERESI